MVPHRDRPMRRCFQLGALLGLVLGASAACGGGDRAERQKTDDRVLVVPTTVSSAPPYRGDGTPSTRRYVVRMSDGERDWEVEFPETASGYQLRIPLNQDDPVDVQGEALTEADKELLASRRRQNVGMEREGIYVNGENQADSERRNQVGGLRPGAELGEDEEMGDLDPWAGSEDDPAPTRQSYFLGIERVRKLYRAGRYEIAVVYLKDLDEDYPEDPKLMSMLGTLYLKLGQEDLAREYWERVLQIDPTDRAVIDALKQLNTRTAAPALEEPAPAEP